MKPVWCGWPCLALAAPKAALLPPFPSPSWIYRSWVAAASNAYDSCKCVTTSAALGSIWKPWQPPKPWPSSQLLW